LHEEIACTVARQFVVPSIAHQRTVVIGGAPGAYKEFADKPSGLWQERAETFATPFPPDPHIGRRDESAITRCQIEEFLNPRTRIVQQSHEEVIALAIGCGAVDLCEQVCELGFREVAEHGARGLLDGDREDPLTRGRQTSTSSS